jgi:hypothetical protein
VRVAGASALAGALLLASTVLGPLRPAASVETPGDLPPIADLLPVDQELDLREEHVSGVVMELTRLAFGIDRITVHAVIENRQTRDEDIALSVLTGANQPTMVLRDDQGHDYPFSADLDDEEVQVPAGTAVEAELVFLGRVDPAAGRLELITNEGRPFGTSEVSTAPTIHFDDLPVAYDQAAVDRAQEQFAAARTRTDPRLPVDRPVLAQATHRNNTTVTVTAVAYELDGVVVDVLVSNRHRLGDAIQLHDARGVASLVLEDDLGNQHHILPPADNPTLSMPHASVVTGRLAFAGGVNPEATHLSLRLNWTGDGELPDGVQIFSRHPSMALPDFEVEW